MEKQIKLIGDVDIIRQLLTEIPPRENATSKEKAVTFNINNNGRAEAHVLRHINQLEEITLRARELNLKYEINAPKPTLVERFMPDRLRDYFMANRQMQH